MTPNLLSGFAQQFMDNLLKLVVPIVQAAGPSCPAGTIKLLEPINGLGCMPVGSGPLGSFYAYFGVLYPWIVGTSAGMAILWGVIGGAEMILNAGEQGKYEEGKQKLMNSMIGLLIIIFSGMILNFLNPSFYLN